MDEDILAPRRVSWGGQVTRWGGSVQDTTGLARGLS